eukprot:11248-Rhodomonas_salina.1
MVLCMTQGLSVGNVSVELSNNGVDFSDDGQAYSARPLSTIGGSAALSLHPSSGSMLGGTVVYIQGGAFDVGDAVT